MDWIVLVAPRICNWEESKNKILLQYKAKLKTKFNTSRGFYAIGMKHLVYLKDYRRLNIGPHNINKFLRIREPKKYEEIFKIYDYGD